MLCPALPRSPLGPPGCRQDLGPGSAGHCGREGLELPGPPGSGSSGPGGGGGVWPLSPLQILQAWVGGCDREGVCPGGASRNLQWRCPNGQEGGIRRASAAGGPWGAREGGPFPPPAAEGRTTRPSPRGHQPQLGGRPLDVRLRDPLSPAAEWAGQDRARLRGPVSTEARDVRRRGVPRSRPLSPLPSPTRNELGPC